MSTIPPHDHESEAEWLADRALVQRTLTGDPVAREELAERLGCVPAMVRAQNVRCGSRLSEDEIEDVVQDTLSALWVKLATFEGRSRLESWAYRFTSNELLKARERRRRADRQSEIDPDAMPGEPAPDEPVADVHLQACLERLTHDYAVVVRMKHYDELTFEQISARVGASSNTVKARYYRGLARLKDALTPYRRKELR